MSKLPSFSYAIRTYGREQLGMTLASIRSSGIKPDNIFLCMDRGTSFTDGQEYLLNYLYREDYRPVIRYSSPGLGVALYSLIALVSEKCKSDAVIFLDDDVVFSHEHVTRLLSHYEKNATYCYTDWDGYWEAVHIRNALQLPFHDMYCTIINFPDFVRTTSMEHWRALIEYNAGISDLFFFGRYLELCGFTPNVLFGTDRPLHIYSEKGEKKSWASVSNDYILEHMEMLQRLSTVAELKEFCHEVNEEVIQLCNG